MNHGWEVCNGTPWNSKYVSLFGVPSAYFQGWTVRFLDFCIFIFGSPTANVLFLSIFFWTAPWEFRPPTANFRKTLAQIPRTHKTNDSPGRPAVRRPFQIDSTAADLQDFLQNNCPPGFRPFDGNPKVDQLIEEMLLHHLAQQVSGLLMGKTWVSRTSGRKKKLDPFREGLANISYQKGRTKLLRQERVTWDVDIGVS